MSKKTSQATWSLWGSHLLGRGLQGAGPQVRPPGGLVSGNPGWEPPRRSSSCQEVPVCRARLGHTQLEALPP